MKQLKVQLADSSKQETVFSMNNVKKLKELLIIDPEDRTRKQIKEIASLVENVRFLNDYKSSKDFNKLCKYLQLKSYPSRAIVFSQNDKADEFFIVLKGSVIVFVDQQCSSENLMIQKEVVRLKAGSSFGELGLLYDSTRSATVITDEIENDLIVLSKQTFQRYFVQGGGKVGQFDSIIEFLTGLEIFKRADQVQRIASKAVIRQFGANTILLKQDQEALNVHFIQQGLVRVFRKVLFKLDKDTGKANSKLLQAPTQEEIRKGQYEETYLQIDELSQGAFFGGMEVLYDIKWAFTAVCITQAKIVTVTKYDLVSILDEDLKNVIEKIYLRYPDDVSLKKTYYDQRKWKDYKRNVLESVTKQNKNDKLSDRMILNIAERGPLLKVHEIDIMKQLNDKLDVPPKIQIEEQINDIKRTMLFSPRQRKEFEKQEQAERFRIQAAIDKEVQEEKERRMTKYEKTLQNAEQTVTQMMNTPANTDQKSPVKKKLSISSVQDAILFNKNVGRKVKHTEDVLIDLPLRIPELELKTSINRQDEMSVMTTQTQLDNEYNESVLFAKLQLGEFLKQVKRERIASTETILLQEKQALQSQKQQEENKLKNSKSNFKVRSNVQILQ